MNKKKSTVIYTDEWLKELLRLSPPKADLGWTLREWAEKIGCSVRVANQRLRQAQEQGVLVLGQRSHVRMDGRPCSVPVYRIEKAERRRSG